MHQQLAYTALRTFVKSVPKYFLMNPCRQFFVTAITVTILFPISSGNKMESAARFIKFTNDKAEIELELGVSVPFLKVPFQSKLPVGGYNENNENNHSTAITVNTAGLLLGTSLLVTTLLIGPLFNIMTSQTAAVHQFRHKKDAHSEGSEFENCSQHIICWIASNYLDFIQPHSSNLSDAKQTTTNLLGLAQQLGQILNSWCITKSNNPNCRIEKMFT